MNEDQNTIANNIQTESIVKKILTSEVKYFIGIVVFIFGVVAPYYQIRTDIALIKENHMAHIEAFDKELVEIKTRQEKQDDTIIKLMQAISKME